ncbi:tRNA adenosine(34) deaminase TadA [Alicyclobacillus dauci]|uniref:tRNA-specific adenosine deaminase n=2 Tax=Alicyclobacillus dauci TaxID=1475485 RepID=A0ABY6Z8A1_9BACL|nr:tRNA adenosine(34) deaminase TadA [Alicyclobacillus dauci]WAH39094.1 tRNA adenosine(34) deaminase TadA [Alicyclobacillus dauci]
MMLDSLDETWMTQALKQARLAGERGEVPIGAVIVRNGEIVATGSNWRETWRDPTAHAELVAIQEASRRLGTWRLTECDLYVTLEPCPMCAGTIMLSRIRRLVFGALDAKGGAIVSKVSLLQPGIWNHTPNITSGVLADECASILKDFFQGLRATRG